MDIHNEVCLLPWQESWAGIFEAEKARIQESLTAHNHTAEVLHVGSSSIEGMVSKPIIDILVCPKDTLIVEEYIHDLEEIGYRCIGECGRPGRFFFSKGDQPGETFYLHLCHSNHPVARDQLLFQRLERENRVIFTRYKTLKEELARMFPDDRNTYRRIKGLFIDGVLSAYRRGNPPQDDDVNYYVYEVNMPPEMAAEIRKTLRENELTINEYIERGLEYSMKHPGAVKKWLEEEGPSDIQLVAYYPVLCGETEAQARKRYMAGRKLGGDEHDGSNDGEGNSRIAEKD